MSCDERELTATPSAEGASSRRARRRQCRIEAFLDAAMQIVADEGLDKLTIARLATALDAATGALYRYFPGKDALLIALHRRVIDDLHRAMSRRMDAVVDGGHAVGASPPVIALAQIAAVAAAFRQYAVDEPAHFNVLQQVLAEPQFLLDADEARSVFESVGPILAMVRARFDFAVESGGLDAGNAYDRTLMLWATLHGHALFRKLERIDPTRLALGRLVARQVRTLMIGWGGRSADIGPALALAGLEERRR